jgi:hypothetical protein
MTNKVKARKIFFIPLFNRGPDRLISSANGFLMGFLVLQKSGFNVAGKPEIELYPDF